MCAWFINRFLFFFDNFSYKSAFKNAFENYLHALNEWKIKIPNKKWTKLITLVSIFAIASIEYLSN